MVAQLALERAPEALHRGIVIVVAFSAHRGLHTELIKQFLVGRAAVLTSTIGMRNEAPGRASGHHRPQEGLADQFCGNPRPQRIPDNLAIEKIFMGRTIEPPFSCGHIAQIAHPALLGRRDSKILTEKILRYRQGVL